MFRVFFKASAEKIFSSLSLQLQEKITGAIFRVANNPFVNHRNLKKLSGFGSGYRMRIGRWRIIYHLNDLDKEIEILDIFLKKGKDDYRRRL